MKRHALDPLAFLFGAIFALSGAMFLSGHVDASKLGGQWAWPALLAGAGLLLMVLTARPARAKGDRRPLVEKGIDDSSGEDEEGPGRDSDSD